MRVRFYLLVAILFFAPFTASSQAKDDAVQRSAAFRAEAEAGNAKAQFNYGLALYLGEGVAADPTEAKKWFEAALRQNDMRAAYNLGAMAFKDGDYSAAMNLYTLAAKASDKAAQYRLGRLYLIPANDDNASFDPRKALHWLEASAKQNYIAAQRALGFLYLDNALGLKNPTKAVQWLKAAADQGDPVAAAYLGTLYAHGQDAVLDQHVAVEWYQLAIANGSIPAMNDLALLYWRGDTLLQDHQAARRWLLSGAEKGDALAQYNLALMLDSGIGAPKETKEALFWLNRSAEQGFGPAQYNLGCHFETTEQNHAKALFWLSLAAINGIKDAAPLIAQLESILPKEEATEILVQAAQWKATPEHPGQAAENEAILP